MGDEASRLAGLVGTSYATLYDSRDQVAVDQGWKLSATWPASFSTGGVPIAPRPPEAMLDAMQRINEAADRIRDWEAQHRDECHCWPYWPRLRW